MPPFSVSPESFGVVQSINVWRAGVRYPGEALIARVWDARWGTPLTGSAMFRVVLLPDRQRVPEADIQDPRITVAVGHTEEWSNRIAGLSQTATELRESTAAYLIPRRRDLDGLRQAVDRRARDIDEATTELARDSLRMGELSSKAGTHRWTRDVSSETEFASDDPTAWIAALGSMSLARAYPHRTPESGGYPNSPLSIRRAFEAATRVQPDAREDRLPQAFVSLGLFGEDGGVDLIAKMLGQDDEISGKELSESLVHQHGMTPDVAFQAVTAVVMQTDAELEWSPGCEVFPIVTKASLGLVEWEAGLLFRIKALRSHPTESWDAALPFIRVIYGDAVGEDESPIAAQAIALKNALTTLQIRLTLTSAVQERLAAATGGVFAPDVEALTLLARLASATSWQDFLGIARTEVDHVSELTEALSRFEKMRRLAAHALDIEWVLRYLVEAEASLLESASLVAARSLVSRVDAEALIERPALWLAIMGSFDQWRTDYRRSYLQAHSARQLQERKLGSMVDSTGHDVTTTRSYSRFIELPDIQLLELLTRWEQVSRTASPCDAEPEALTLIRSPFCRQCRMQMSSAADCSELEIVSAEITSVLERFTEKLSALAVDDVLTDRRTNEIERLLKLRGVADLSALDGVLGARLSEFLSGYLSRGSDSKPA